MKYQWPELARVKLEISPAIQVRGNERSSSRADYLAQLGARLARQAAEPARSAHAVLDELDPASFEVTD